LSLEKLDKIAEIKDSRLILAIDIGVLEEYSLATEETKIVSLLGLLKDYVVGVKFGLPTIISLGYDKVKSIVKKFSDEYYFIADLKIADVPFITLKTCEIVKSMGFNAAIIHLFTQSIHEIKHRLDEMKLATIGVLTMSHNCPIIEKNFEELLEYAIKASVNGVVIGATKLEYIRKFKGKCNNVKVFAPGIICQGGKPGESLKAGADYEIVGRAIVQASSPFEAAKYIVELEREVTHG